MIQSLTPDAIAFIKSRSCDPLSSFGDFICCSGVVDVITAKLIKHEVCDGIATVDIEPEALEILKSKKGGKFIIIQMDTKYYDSILINGWTETKSIYGVEMTQPCNNFLFNPTLYGLANDDFDAIIAYVILKYSQSNNASMVYNEQLLGLGCGQHNRVGCVKLSGEKTLNWQLRQSNDVIKYYKSLSNELKRQETVNLVYEYIDNNKEKLCANLDTCDITLGSDGFFPFADNIVEAHNYGVTRILQPGDSVMDDNVSNKCNELNINMCNICAIRFYH